MLEWNWPYMQWFKSSGHVWISTFLCVRVCVRIAVVVVVDDVKCYHLTVFRNYEMNLNRTTSFDDERCCDLVLRIRVYLFSWAINSITFSKQYKIKVRNHKYTHTHIQHIYTLAREMWLYDIVHVQKQKSHVGKIISWNSKKNNNKPCADEVHRGCVASYCCYSLVLVLHKNVHLVHQLLCYIQN